MMMIRLSSIKIALLIGMIYSRISLEQMKTAFDEVFKDKKYKNLEYTIVNPLFGYMFRVNGCVENLRFFSSEVEIQYTNNVRNYKLDKSKDSLTSLVIHLFPSHIGDLNNFRGTDLNFTNMYFKCCEPYDKEDKDNNREANIKMLGDTFVELLKSGTKKNFPKPSKTERTPYSEFKYFVTIPSSASHLKDDEIIIKLLTLYAYVLEELDSENELKICLKRISDGLGKDPAIKYPALLLNDKQKQLFKRFYINPFKFPYSKINRPASNSSIPIYDRKEDKFIESETFSDCVDITILHLCNCLFYDELAGECSLVHLNNLKDTPTESNRLKQFYEKYNYKPFGMTQEMRKDWSRVVQGLNDNKAFECQSGYKPYTIHYGKQKYRNEIRSGLFNTMAVLANICGVNDDKYKKIMTKEPISKDSVVDKLTEFFYEISNGNIKITIIKKGLEGIAHKNVGDFIGDFYITLDLEHSNTSVTMKLHISKYHTSCFFESMKSEVEEADWTASENDNYILSSIITKYVKLLNNKDNKTENFDCAFEVLYNQEALRTNEQKRDQCVYLCEFIDKNKIFDHEITKRVIGNIVKSANLSDPATSIMFRPFFIYIDDIFKKMSNYEVVESWLSVFSNKYSIDSQVIKNIWNEAVKKNSMKIRSMGFAYYYADSIDDVKAILSAIKGTLEDLKLRNLTVDPKNFKQMIKKLLIDNKVLKALAFPGNELSSTSILYLFKLLKKNESLRTLDLSYNKFNDKDTKLLANAVNSIRSVNALDISSIFLEDAGSECIVDILANNKTLTTLEISDKNIKRKNFEAVAAALEENKTLTTLIISSSYLDVENIKYLATALKRNETLTTLDISYNDIGSDGLECIADALENNKTLTTLNISKTFCHLETNNDFAKYLAKIIQRNAILTTLDISYNGLDAKDAEHIAEALKSNTTLIDLNISKNNLQKDGAKHMADALRSNKKLKKLDISENNIEDEGAEHITSIFVENVVHEGSDTLSSSGCANKTLAALNISSNNIRSKGAKHIADAIEKSEYLTWLDINDNNIENEGINCIANALAKNKFLKVLHIQLPYFNTGDSKTILKALEENRSLAELSLNYFGSQYEMAKSIADGLKDNKTLKTLIIIVPDYTSIEDRAFLCKAIEENTFLEKVVFRKKSDSYIIISDRMPFEDDTDRYTDSKSSKFQRIEIYLEIPDICF